jgi:hypothetical protein
MQWAFGEDIRAGRIRSPLDIRDVWPSSYSGNTNEILWGAQAAARMPWSARAPERYAGGIVEMREADGAGLPAPARACGDGERLTAAPPARPGLFDRGLAARLHSRG